MLQYVVLKATFFDLKFFSTFPETTISRYTAYCYHVIKLYCNVKTLSVLPIISLNLKVQLKLTDINLLVLDALYHFSS